MAANPSARERAERLAAAVVARILRLPPPADRDVTVERDVAVPMDDGAELRADIYTPAGPGPHPTVLVRSPYGRRGPFGLLLGRVFAEHGYRVAVQSCRGTAGSGGTFRPHFDERADGLATIRWIEGQDWFDGRLALNGPSYLGGVQWAVADSAGPALRALCTHVTFSNIARHWYRGGSFALLDTLGWTSGMCRPGNAIRGADGRFVGRRRRNLRRAANAVPLAGLDRTLIGATIPFWHEFIDHPSVDDPFWAPIDHSARVAEVKAPVLQVGGWYDLFLPDQLADHRTLTEAGTPVRLVVGPWTHTSARGFAAQVTESLAWLDHHVRHLRPADVPADDVTKVRLLVMGSGRWRSFDAWPPPGHAPRRWYLHDGGRLGPEEPEAGAPGGYRFDPADPTPPAGGTLLQGRAGRRDQRRRERRPDVLLYTSDVLTDDVEVIGPVSAEVHAEADLPDFDIFVRLCDVGPRDRSYNVCDGIERVSAARSPRPADGVWTVAVTLWPTAHLFRAGHRIRLQVGSGAHPRFARNPGTGEALATATTMKPVNVRIHHGGPHPSAVVLPVACQ